MIKLIVTVVEKETQEKYRGEKKEKGHKKFQWFILDTEYRIIDNLDSGRNHTVNALKIDDIRSIIQK